MRESVKRLRFIDNVDRCPELTMDEKNGFEGTGTFPTRLLLLGINTCLWPGAF